MQHPEIMNFLTRSAKGFGPGHRFFKFPLIVLEESSPLEFSDVSRIVMSNLECEKIIYDQHSSDEMFFEELIYAFRQGQSVYIELKHDPSLEVIDQLKRITDQGVLDFRGSRSLPYALIEVPGNIRLIFSAKRRFLEEEVSFNGIYSFFGSILSV
jgi:hypothetical protein